MKYFGTIDTALY
jgi:sugar phosphate permease